MIHNCFQKCTLVLLLLLPMAMIKLSAQQLVDERFQHTPLQEVFELFTNKYGLLLSYDPNILAEQTVNLQVREDNVLQAFYQVLDASSLDYLTLDKQRILIRPAAEVPKPLSYWSISGTVTDQETGIPLPYATVYCARYGWGASTDGEGRFQLSIPDTIQQTLQIEGRYLGYESTIHRLKPGPGRRIDFQLPSSLQEISMVIVTDEVSPLGINNDEQALIVRPDESLPELGASPDVMRNLQMLPGVSASNEQSSALQVRGGQSTDNLMLWDGMLLYNVDHLFGTFSSLNGNLVESVQLYKNTFPIEYAGRSASVLKIHSYDLEDQASTHLNLGNLSVDGATRIKISKDLEVQLGARASLNRLANTTLFNQLSQRVEADGNTIGALLEESNQVQIQPAFSFYDFNAKLAWQATDRAYFDVNTFRSADQYNYDYSLLFNTRLQNRIGENSIQFLEETNWQNEAYSARWLQSWNAEWKSELSLGYSSYQIDENSETILRRERPDGNFSSSIRSNKRSNEVGGYHLNWTHTYQRSTTSELTFGTRFTDEQVQLQISNDSVRLLQNDAEATQIGFYAAQNWQWEKWRLQFGLHATHYTATRKTYASPRLLLGYRADEHWYLKGSLNLYHQYLRRYYSENRFGRSFEVWTLANDNFWPVAQTQQAMLGFTFRKDRFSLDIEGFYKYIDGVLEYTTLFNNFADTETGGVASGENTFRISQGTGQVVGLDLLVRQEWDQFQTYLAYTLSRSTRQFSDLFQGLTYASQDDRPHQIQWVNTLQSGKWSFSGVYVMASGRPYLDLSSNNVAADRRERLPENLRRIPNYHRVDLSARYEIPINKTKVHASLSVLNLLDHDNTLYEQQIYSIPTQNNRNFLLGNELQLMNRTWSISLGVHF